VPSGSCRVEAADLGPRGPGSGLPFALPTGRLYFPYLHG
jgi:hypothetical protein